MKEGDQLVHGCVIPMVSYGPNALIPCKTPITMFYELIIIWVRD